MRPGLVLQREVNRLNKIRMPSLHILEDNEQGGQTLLAIDEFVAAVISPAYNDGLEAVILVSIGVYIIEKAFYFFLSPAVSALIRRDEILSADITDKFRLEYNVVIHNIFIYSMCELFLKLCFLIQVINNRCPVWKAAAAELYPFSVK